MESDNNLIDFNLALSVAKMYGLTDAQALEELREIKNVVESNWRRLARQYGLSRSEIESMAPAFDMGYKSWHVYGRNAKEEIFLGIIRILQYR